MLFLRKITQDHLLREFRERYIRISGLNVPEDFLKTRDVYAAFNLRNKMCGGFMFIVSTSLNNKHESSFRPIRYPGKIVVERSRNNNFSHPKGPP